MTHFKDILGQDEAIARIQQAYRADRLPHGLIFSGPAGIGKGTSAAALAALFLCETPGKTDACGKCRSCIAFAAGSHPDYHVVTKELARVYDRSGTSKATQLSIEVVRQELVAPAGRKALLGRGKVFIIEQAELMTAAAQNALLKTLEEPAGRTLIVLIASSTTDLLPTVRSRCQVIPFASLDEELVRKQLERRGVEHAVAAEAAQLCDGSLGIALRWVEDGFVVPAGRVATAMDAILAGKSVELAELLKAAGQAKVDRTIQHDEFASKDAAMRDALRSLIAVGSRRLRQRLSDADESDIACDAIDAMALAEKYLDANVNVSLILQNLEISLARLATGKALA